jgi:predicted esterase
LKCRHWLVIDACQFNKDPNGPCPIRISHAQPDNRLSIAGSHKLVEELATLGNDVTFRIHPAVADHVVGPHFGVIATDTPALVTWFRQQLGG